MHENIVLDSLDKINPLVIDIKMNNRPCDKIGILVVYDSVYKSFPRDVSFACVL